MRLRAAAFLLGVLVAPVQAQEWDSPEALGLVRRAVNRRQSTVIDSSLRSYRATAQGFVFFLAQIGASGLTAPPRLVKADQLVNEVYWRFPDLSKQTIIGWRDSTFLPTDIAYHRDHLGIVTNNFGNFIRIGEGDEVRDAVHPLSPEGMGLYEYSLEDSLSIAASGGTVEVFAVEVRPKSFKFPLVIGTMYLDSRSADLVRFSFSFTPASYLDKEVEDITVVIENALFEGRYWLPYHQEIEIRRRAVWLDFPARSIIRGRWEIGDYEFNVMVPPAVAAGPAIGGLTRPRGQAFPWPDPLAQAIATVAGPVNAMDMQALRVQVEEIADTRALGGLPQTRLAGGSVSDLAHVNRVQGLALGMGAVIGVGHGILKFRPTVGYGFSDHTVTGGLVAQLGIGKLTISALGLRKIDDFSDYPIISGVLNSFTSQETGNDHGDYVLTETLGGGFSFKFDSRNTLAFEFLNQASFSVGTDATPATGEYQPNPPLGAGRYAIFRARYDRSHPGIGISHDIEGSAQLEAGEGPTEYGRITVDATWRTRIGRGRLLTMLGVGWGVGDLPAYRSFVMGGRGTLVGAPFRAYGGARAILGHLEYQVDLSAPAVSLGSFATTGKSVTLAPYVAAGWTDQAIQGTPWVATDGVVPVIGLAAEFIMRIIRVEVGIDVRTGRVGVVADVSREWWGLL